MNHPEERTVGGRGQVTLPKELRERLNIRGGDQVLVREEDGKIVIEKSVTREEFAEGYRRRAATSKSLTAEVDGVSREANEDLGDVPEW